MCVWKIEEIIKENKLQNGVKVTENLITTTKNYLQNKYKKKGFLNAKVLIKTEKISDSTKKSRVKMFIDIDKGNKIKNTHYIWGYDLIIYVSLLTYLNTWYTRSKHSSVIE